MFFTARGHQVFRVSSQKAADLRRFLSRHAKSNGIDADTLARLPLFDPAGLRPLQLPGAERAALDRRVRATDRLTRAAANSHPHRRSPDQAAPSFNQAATTAQKEGPLTPLDIPAPRGAHSRQIQQRHGPPAAPRDF